MTVLENLNRIQSFSSGTPQRPTILSVAPKGDEISIKWTYGENGGKEIKNVVIEYTPMDSSQWERVTINDSDLEHYTIKNLRPQTQYRFRVFAVNEIGSSDPSAEHLGTTLLEGRVCLFLFPT